MAEQSWWKFQYNLWHDAFSRGIKLPIWMFLTLGPVFLDWWFTDTPEKTTTVPWWGWAIWWLAAVLVQFAFGVGEKVRELG